MTELPDELRELLNLARDAHDPTDPGAAQRVRQAVAASLLMGGAATGSSSLFPQSQALASNTQTLGASVQASKAGWLLFGSKAGTLVVGGLAAAGLALGAYSFSRQPPPARVSPQVVAQPTAQSATALPAPEPVVPQQAEPVTPQAVLPVEASVSKPKPRSQPSAESLAAETALLRGASEALARGDEQAALLQLKEHGRRFPAGSLREERDGLRAIAECTRDNASNPSATAKKFLRSYPGSLLGARVSKACAAE